MINKRKICIVTGTRAEYGLLYWLMREIQDDEALELQLIVTGMHLSPEFGLTYQTIEKDGFKIDEKVEMLLSSDTPVGITKSIGLGVIGFADALDRLKPDIMVLLGDRYEALAAAQAAMVANIPIAHIHGGETTEGAIDEAIRHSITKMSQIHFVSAEPYRKRVIQLGEQPDRVYNFGAPGTDNIVKMKLMDLDELENSIDFKLGEKFFLVTYHPVTMHLNSAEKAMQNLLDALDKFQDYKILFTKPNSDTGGRIISKMIDDYTQNNPERVFSATSLGQLRYLSAMKLCSAVIGNSSSGIIEAPVFRKPTVNIGERQSGRLRMLSIVDCSEKQEFIERSIIEVISEKFMQKLKDTDFAENDGNISRRIKNILKNVELSNICKKQFYDLD